MGFFPLHCIAEIARGKVSFFDESLKRRRFTLVVIAQDFTTIAKNVDSYLSPLLVSIKW